MKVISVSVVESNDVLVEYVVLEWAVFGESECANDVRMQF